MSLAGQWRSLEEKREIFHTRIFSLCAEFFECLRTGAKHEFITLATCDWVNVIAETADHKIVMIRQFRHGSRTEEWEIPGGCIDPSDSSPEQAGARELLEETGFAGDQVRIIGKVRPNPAIQGNVCYTVKIENARVAAMPTPEPTECIETHLVPAEKLRRMVADGTIAHGLVLNAIYFNELERENR